MPKTLLLADDSVTIQKVVGISFANENVRLVTVDNGDDAIARVRELKPDAVLADVVMPGKSGYEVCEIVKSAPELRHIPVLLLTGTFEAFDAERAQRAGADGHITKPFEAQTLVDRVNELLARAPLPAATPAAAEISEDFLDDEAPAALVDDFELGDDEEAFVFESGETAEAPAGDLETGETADPFAEPASRSALLATAPDLGADDADDMDDATPERPLATAALEGPAPASTPEFEAHPDPLEVSESGIADFDRGAVPVVARPTSEDHNRTTVLDPAGSDAFDVSSADLGATAGGGSEQAEAAGAEGLEESGSVLETLSPGPSAAPMQVEAPARSARETAAPAPFATLPDDVRRQLLDQLEKVAWEAFGGLAETLVRETIAKVQAVAWEVVPQLAESLIREEIRKLKEDD